MAKYYTKISDEDGNEFLLAVNITGHGAPTEDTEAEPGMCYLDEDSEHGDLYKCIGVLVTETRTVYRWKKLAGQEEVERLSEAKADKAGWTPDKYIGTDENGNLIEKDAPAGDGGWKIDELTAETVIADDDTLPFYDTSAKGQRKTLWSNFKAVLKTYFDAVYLKLSGGTVNGTLNLNGNLIMPLGSNGGIRDNTDNPVMRYETINNEASLRLGHKGVRFHVLSSERPMYNGFEFAIKNDIPDTYSKSQIDAIMGSYVNDIDALIGGDE